MPAGLRLPYWASQPQPAVQLDVILLLRCRFPLSSETDGCQQQHLQLSCFVINIFFFHNHIILVRHSKFHVEIFVQFTLILQLIKEMEGRAPDLLDAMATVTVPVAKEDEVKCLQCVIYG